MSEIMRVPVSNNGDDSDDTITIKEILEWLQATK